MNHGCSLTSTTSTRLVSLFFPDLMQASRDAVGSMIDLLCKDTGMDAVEAYMLCSVCGDLRISEIVDMPNWTVSFYFPKVVFE